MLCRITYISVWSLYYSKALPLLHVWFSLTRLDEGEIPTLASFHSTLLFLKKGYSLQVVLEPVRVSIERCQKLKVTPKNPEDFDILVSNFDDVIMI